MKIIVDVIRAERKAWSEQFAGGMISFDKAYWDEQRAGGTIAEAQVAGVSALLDAFVERLVEVISPDQRDPLENDPNAEEKT